MSLILALFLSFNLQADYVDFAGTLLKQNGRNFLRYDHSAEPVEIRGSTALVNKIIGALGNFDLASGRAEQITTNIWLVNNINFVGIRKILGRWVSVGPDRMIYDFKNHFDLRISNAFQNTSGFKTGLSGNHTYSVAPVDGNLYRIFISDTDNVLIANLVFSKNSMTLDFLNTTTGEKVDSLTLTRMK